MGFLSDLTTKTAELATGLSNQVAKFKNADFAKGAMATCALIASADGTIDPSEKQKTVKLIGANDALKVFDVAELRAHFETYCEKLESDLDFGKLEAIQQIGKLKKTPEQARACVQIGVIIGKADGNFDAKEKAIVKEICNAVGIDPKEFDVA